MAGTQAARISESLAKVLEVFPDISLDFVRSLCNKSLVNGDLADLTIIDEILTLGTYPKERDEARKLRGQPEASEAMNEAEAWETPARVALTREETQTA